MNDPETLGHCCTESVPASIRDDAENIRDDAENIVRARCLETCAALLCERNGRCMALLYDTPGFSEQIDRVEREIRARRRPGGIPQTPAVHIGGPPNRLTRKTPPSL